MDKDPRQELCEIVGQVRGHLALQQELGVEHTDLSWPKPAPRRRWSARPWSRFREELGEWHPLQAAPGRTQIVFESENPRPAWSSWARRRAPMRTPRASLSWAAPGNSSPRSSRRWASAGRTYTSAISSNVAPQQSHTRGGRDRGLPAVPAAAAPGHRAQVHLRPGRTRHADAPPDQGDHLASARPIHDFHGIPLLPTFHPAFLLRNPSEKKTVWEDMKLLLRHLQA